MSHKSLLVFATVLPSDEDFDEIMLAAVLFIIYFCNKISISHLFYCMLAHVKPVQNLFWMYSPCLYLKQFIEKYRHCRAAELAELKGETVVIQLLLPQVPQISEQMFSWTFSDTPGQTGWKYYFHHIKNNMSFMSRMLEIWLTQFCSKRCSTKTRPYLLLKMKSVLTSSSSFQFV